MMSSLPGPPMLTRQKSEIEKELERNDAQATAMVQMSAVDEEKTQPVFQYDMQLKGCVFVGHTNTDLDSIAAAIGAAHLFGGTAARASEINTETEWVLKHWGFPCPPMFADIEGVQDRDVCLVDFNQRSQLTKGVDEKKIKGIIDHHALRDGAVATDFPIYIDVRPWGSVATILSHTYFRNRVKMPKTVAGLLLSAILSDTLNLNSPTCTDIDKLMVAALSKIAGVKDVDNLAEQQFKAKSKMLLRYSIPEILRGDLKRFKIRDIMLAFGVCETTDVKTVLKRRTEILNEMRAMKAEEQDTYVFFAIIDVAKLHSTLIICGRPEKATTPPPPNPRSPTLTVTLYRYQP
uniref:inorganic diphosphatase n=1 Tax=Lotharella globosa TaxID=91324 RepID=A0A7S4DHV5_9EUKA